MRLQDIYKAENIGLKLESKSSETISFSGYYQGYWMLLSFHKKMFWFYEAAIVVIYNPVKSNGEFYTNENLAVLSKRYKKIIQLWFMDRVFCHLPLIKSNWKNIDSSLHAIINVLKTENLYSYTESEFLKNSSKIQLAINQNFWHGKYIS